jgi:hypothetical protein
MKLFSAGPRESRSYALAKNLWLVMAAFSWLIFPLSLTRYPLRYRNTSAEEKPCIKGY